VGLRHLFGYGNVVGTIFSDNVEQKYYFRDVTAADLSCRNLTFSVTYQSVI
jgi:hypothetical protein